MPNGKRSIFLNCKMLSSTKITCTRVKIVQTAQWSVKWLFGAYIPAELQKIHFFRVLNTELVCPSIDDRKNL